MKSLNKSISKVVLSQKKFSFDRFFWENREDLWYRISIIRYAIEYIFIMCWIYIIDIVIQFYKARQT